MSNAWDAAGQELQNSRLYVHPDAEDELDAADIPFTQDEQEEALALLDGADTPIWVAVLPVSAADAQTSVEDLYRVVGQDGTYVSILTDGRVDARSTQLRGAGPAAREVSQLSQDMFEFIEGAVPRYEQMADAASSTNNGDGAAAPDPRGGGGGLLPLAILAAAGGGGFLLYRRNKRNRERAELEQVRNALDEDITTYGERLSELDLDVQTNSAVPVEARRDYERALDLYENAKVYTDRAERPTDLRAVTNALEEGRWLLGCVDARLNDRPLPDHRSPCFFDPGHGPSVEDIDWAPPGGVPRPVPACAADALRLKQGLEPSVRTVDVGGERRPYWDAGPAYGGWAAGYFGAVLPAMMVGTMLGTTMAAPLAYGGGFDGGGGGDFGGGFDGGGGGDFGGGFDGGGGGGGDFGGGFGDFGGF